MRCVACDRVLTTFEMVQRCPESGQFADLCNVCFRITFDLADDEDTEALIYFEGINYEQDE